jgi:hypothetical protein
MGLRRINKISGRHYELPTGVVVPSVTTILDAINKPGLVHWAAKEERQLCLDRARALYERLPAGEKLSGEEFLRQLDEEIGEEKANKRKMRDAADYGGAVHDYIEWHLKHEIGLACGDKPALPPGGELSWRSYRQFRRMKKIHVRLVEVQTFSCKHGYAGTTDWVGVSRALGRDVVGDWKTSKSMHGEQVLQAVAYVMALVENGTLSPPVDAFVVRLPKEESSPELEVRHVKWEEMPELFDVFLAAKRVWHWMYPDWATKHSKVAAA